MFLSGWLGGPDLFVQKFGHPMLRARHLPFPVDEGARDQWLYCMYKAMQETPMPDALRERLEQSFFNTADFMRNQD
jgi:hemoglobin